MLDWKRNLPTRKRGLVADVRGARFWIHPTGRCSYRLTYRLPGSETIWHHDVLFGRQMHAKEVADRLARAITE